MTKTILMIHGMFGGHGYWDKFQSFFENRGYRCLTPILRHHDMDPKGEPHPDLGTTSLVDFAADMEKIILNLDEPPIIIGHSMGGLIAQMLGAKGLAEKLILLTPGPPRGVVSYKGSSIGVYAKEFFKWGWWKKPIRFGFEITKQTLFNCLPDEDKQTAHNRMVYESGRAALEIGFWLFDSKKASCVDTSTVTCPILVVGAKQDKSTPPALVKKIAEYYSHVSIYKEFAEHAHWIMNEPGWEKVAGYVCQWIEKD